MLHISIAPETIGHIGSFPITNSLLTAWLVVIVTTIGAFLFSKTFRHNNQTLLKTAVESSTDALLSLMTSVAGTRERAIRFFPFVATLFAYVLISNWSGILPGVGSIGFYETTEHGEIFAPIFRSVYSDLNMTIALAIITVIGSHIIGLKTMGKIHIGKYINLHGPINFFAGILEIVGEFSKIVSLSFRLFGNVFAGEVLLTIMVFLVPYIAPIPFLGMELFVGLIQAAIFATLAMVSFASAVENHQEH